MVLLIHSAAFRAPFDGEPSFRSYVGRCSNVAQWGELRSFSALRFLNALKSDRSTLSLASSLLLAD